MVYALGKEYNKPLVVGYKNDGTPISLNDLRQRAIETSKRVKSVVCISQEELDKEIENW